VNAFNGTGELGYFKDNKPYGKLIQFTDTGKVIGEGIFDKDNLVQKEEVKDFIRNKEPNMIQGMSKAQMEEIDF